MAPCNEIISPWWDWHPPVGVFIAFLALVGVLVPWFRGEASPREKAFWTFLMFLFVGLEIRSIYLDQQKNNRDQEFARCQELQQFQAIATTLGTAITTSQGQFTATMQQFSLDNQNQQDRFSALVQQDVLLFNHEKQLADAQSGVLSPASDPTPPNGCDMAPITQDEIKVIFDQGNAIVATSFPQYLFTHRNQNATQSLRLDKKPNGDLVLIGAVRSEDGKVMAQLSESGWMINRNNTLGIVEDKHTLIVYDLYGNEALHVRYLNPRAISVTGTAVKLVSGGPTITNGCMESRYGIIGP